jgi:hypothetical protein
MHKHPTPVEIKAAIYKQLCLVAAQNSMLSSDVVLAMNAIDEGIRQANKEHDEFMKAMNNV